MIQTPPFISRLRMARRVHTGVRTDLPTTHRNLRLCVSLLVLLVVVTAVGVVVLEQAPITARLTAMHKHARRFVFDCPAWTGPATARLFCIMSSQP
jgi:hypothetical protein